MVQSDYKGIVFDFCVVLLIFFEEEEKIFIVLKFGTSILIGGKCPSQVITFHRGRGV